LIDQLFSLFIFDTIGYLLELVCDNLFVGHLGRLL